MSLESDLRTDLLANAPLAALVGQQLRPDKADPSDGLPYIVYIVKRTPHCTLDNVLRTTQYEFRMQCWAETRDECEAVADALEAALQTSALEPPNGIAVDGRHVIADHDLDLEGTELAFELWKDA